MKPFGASSKCLGAHSGFTILNVSVLFRFLLLILSLCLSKRLLGSILKMFVFLLYWFRCWPDASSNATTPALRSSRTETKLESIVDLPVNAGAAPPGVQFVCFNPVNELVESNPNQILLKSRVVYASVIQQERKTCSSCIICASEIHHGSTFPKLSRETIGKKT